MKKPINITKDQLNDFEKSLPSDKEIKTYLDTLPYYGHCNCEYHEGFENGVKWLKEYLKNNKQ